MASYDYFPRSLKKKIFRYVQANSPKDTGNLRYNAIQGRLWSNGNKFHIRFSVEDAYYIEYLEEKNMAGGSETKENKHKGFIERMFGEISNELDDYFGRNVSFVNKHLQKGERKNTLQREFRHNKSLELYKLQSEANQ